MTANTVSNGTASEKRRILVIDDEKGVREMLRDMLEEAGHTVTIAADGDAGIESMEKHGADLVLTDILMPQKEGIATIVALRRQDPNIRIIAMSGGGRTRNLDFLKVAKKMGANATLAKPFTMDALLNAVNEVLGSKS